MTEVAIRSHGAVAVAEPNVTAAVATLADWATELDAAYTMAVKLVTTPFAPRHFQGKPADAAAAILTGHELGLSPMASLRSIFLISGTPGMYAKAMVAVVQAQGHHVWIAEQGPDRVVVKGWRKGNPDHVYETVWDRDRVVKAKLTGNAKYQESPQQMMVARGQAEICRQVASDALHGIPYSVEELEDLPPTMRVEASVAPRVTAADILANAPAPAAPADEDPIADLPISKPGGRPVTKAQLGMMGALAGELGLTDRDARLAYVAGIINRDISSANDLSSREASAVIDAMNRAKEVQAAAEPTQETPVDEDWPAAAQPADAQ